jgi:chromosome segregation ATPase
LRGEMQAQRTEHSALLSTLRGDLQTAQDEVLKMVQLGRDQQRRFDVEQVAWRAREQQLVEAGTATLTREKELEDKMLSFKTGCDEANQKAVSLEALYAKLVEECEASRAEAVALRSECREQRTRGDHSEAQLLSLQEELARARTDHTQMQTSLVTQEALREAEATAREAGALAAEAETTVASLQQELSRVQGRLATAEALPHRLRDEIRRATEGNVKQVERVEAEMSQLRELLREEAGKTTMLQEERDALSKRVGVMQDQVRQLTMDAKGMNAAEFEDTFEAVMREEFDAMRNAYEGKLKALQADASKQRNAHDKSVRDVQKELRSKMVTLRTDVMRRDATIAQMRKEIEDLKK